MDTDRSASPPEYFPENWGHWVFVLRPRQVRDHPGEQASCTWGYGKFTVRGSRTKWTFTDGGGIAPSGAANRPGEVFVFDFSAYRDTVKLTPVKGQISPETSATSRGAGSRTRRRGGTSASAVRLPAAALPG